MELTLAFWNLVLHLTDELGALFIYNNIERMFTY